MRQVVLDTETTGLEVEQEHRIIEIGCVEIFNRRLTGRSFHQYLNPEREIDAGAAEVHGMTWEDLREKPKFADVAPEFLAFAQGAQWVIHNAPFDVAFIDAELERAGLPRSSSVYGALTDTLALARESFPGKRNNLDTLCERFGISYAHRTLHGALLDAELLAEVYLAMTRGQESLTIDMGAPSVQSLGEASAGAWAGGAGAPRPALRVSSPSAEEMAAHRDYLEALDRDSKGRCVWLTLEREKAA